MARNIFKNIANNRTRKHLIEKFTKKAGLIYFGAVDQHRDEHQIIRGFTVSSTHNDNHYSVGSVDGYDVMLADRSDTIPQIDGSVATYNWLIMAFDLHTDKDIPHIFIGANSHSTVAFNSLFAVYPMLIKVKLGTFENYDPEFTNRFTIYAQPSDSIEIEKLFPSTTTRVLSAHFWPFSAEINEGILYIYSNEKQITQNMLDTMIQNGLWLAKQIDSQIESI